MNTNQRTKRSQLEAIAGILGLTIHSNNKDGTPQWAVFGHNAHEPLFTGSKKECLTYLQGAQYAKNNLTDTVE
jgi:hypothetical protein